MNSLTFPLPIYSCILTLFSSSVP